MIKLKTWFTADTHFNHGNIIKYTNRPFKSVEHMDVELIRRWNSRVGKHDLVIFLGDFCFKGLNKTEDYLNQLNGHVAFLRGNHDNNNSLNTHIESLVIYISKQYVYCTHRPVNHNPYYKINLVGHVHDKWRVKQTRKGCYLVNVGVDVWKYAPVDINEILLVIAKFKRGKKE